MIYTPDTTLQTALRTQDLTLAREMLQVILDDNSAPDNDVQYAFDWAVSQNPFLLEPFDTNFDPLNVDPIQWTTEYYFRQKVWTSKNFSRERFEHLIVVRNHFRRKRDPQFITFGKDRVAHHQLAAQTKEAPEPDAFNGRTLLILGMVAVPVVIGLLLV